MNPYIGDRPLDPPEVYDCQLCHDSKTVVITNSRDYFEFPCPECSDEEE